MRVLIDLHPAGRCQVLEQDAGHAEGHAAVGGQLGDRLRAGRRPLVQPAGLRRQPGRGGGVEPSENKASWMSKAFKKFGVG